MDKANLILNSTIELVDVQEEGKGKGRPFISRFIEPGIAHYKELGDILITKETLNKFINTMVGCPVIIEHEDVTDANADKLRVGVVSRVWFSETDGYFYCEGILTDPEAIDLVKNQGYNVSCAYSFVSDNTKRLHNGKEIDMEFIDGEFLHLALVKDPRYEGANIVVNSNVKNDNPNHEPAGTLKGGQFASKNELIYENINNDIKNLIQKTIEKYGTPKNLEKISAYNFKNNENMQGKEGRYNNKTIELNNNEEIKSTTVLHEFAHSLYEDFSTEQKEKIEIAHKKYLEDVTNYIDKTGDIKLEKFKNKVGANAHWRDSEEFFCDCFAKHNEDNGENTIAKELIRTLKIEKKVNNIGDTVMQVLNELKEFIKSVVSNEKEEEMKEVKNEDKRKLIDEVGGILKGKVDEELWRTVIGKLEKVAYEPSEDDKTDNEDDKEKEAKNKCKNEEDEEAKEDVTKNEDKPEDDGEDKEEDKPEDKAENKKVKNSMRDMVMGGSSNVQEQKLYISRKERLEEGNKY